MNEKGMNRLGKTSQDINGCLRSFFHYWISLLVFTCVNKFEKYHQMEFYYHPMIFLFIKNSKKLENTIDNVRI